jgi:hypothetical protein
MPTKKVIIKRKSQLTNWDKRCMIFEKYHDDLGMLNAMEDFITLPDTYFKMLLNWKEKEWWNYNCLREWELYGNRHLCDVPVDKRSPTDNREDYGDEKEILTVELFNKFNKNKDYSYEFYNMMSSLEN